MRFLGGLALIMSALVAGAAFGGLDVIQSLLDERSRPMIVAVSGASLGVVLTAIMVMLYQRARFARLVIAAERLAAGQLETTVESDGHGLEGRLGRAINGISSSILAKHDAATVDRLTGVASRQALLAALFTEVDRASRYGRPFSVAFMDIDHFKQVNDTYGHAAGDVVLRGVAQAVRANLRATDLIGRYGGEEFLLLLTETDVDDAAILAEKLRNLVGRIRFDVDGTVALTVTVSIGIAGGVGQALRTDQLVRDADAAMYSAKSLGRNQTYIFAEPSDDARVPRAPISPLGRARAQEIGAVARAAAERALIDVVAPSRGTAVNRRRWSSRSWVRWPVSSTCPRPSSSACALPRSCTTSARSPFPPRSSKSRPGSRRPNGEPWSSIRASRRSSSSRHRRSRTPSRSSSITTSGTRGTATRLACGEVTFRSARACLRSPTPTRR
jgi:diguanylate cyclase (GGDEF)-like protein